ncbi:MAG: glycosyltransferase family 4 protein, partial [Clostridia bacterium]|nr:glycosyltransferase family 4 protein [Clostridia bacterium]
EGMSLSIPAIATTYGGNPYMITDGVNGFLVPERDPAAMAERICEIIENPSLYTQLSKGAYEIYEKKFTASAMTRQLEELYVKSYVKHVEK